LGIISYILDQIGSLVDELFLAPAKLTVPLWSGSVYDRATYAKELDYYIDNGFTDKPETFFSLPDELTSFSIIEQTPYSSGVFEVISYQSGYEARNPLIRKRFHAYSKNKTGYLVRWRHNDAGRKTVLCVHGFMMGEPWQAHRMFRVNNLFEMGLDVALFIHPYHWRRSPGGRLASKIFLSPDDACFMSECIGQSVYDLGNATAILKARGAEEVGLIGASLGGYVAAAFICNSDAPRFAALMVPAVNFMQPLGPQHWRRRFPVDEVLWEKIAKVCGLTSPLNLSPKIPAENIMVVASRGDRLCPFEPVLALCKKWGLARCHFRTGGHWLVFTNIRGRAWYGFLQDMKFSILS
jgi:pimeloyl-ACP methyl ester carboxylesterase